MNQKHQTFIIEMIRHGDKIRAYQAAYPGSKGEACRKAAERLLKDPAVATPIDEAVAHIKHQALWEAAQERKEQEKKKILTVERKRELLAQIANGETRSSRHVRLKDDYIVVYDLPKPLDIIKAIELDSKLAGDHYKEAGREADELCAGFQVYIDGKAMEDYQDAHAPINPNIPRGLVLIPKAGIFMEYLEDQEQRKRNNMEQNACLPTGREQNKPGSTTVKRGKFQDLPTKDHLYQQEYPAVPDYQHLPALRPSHIIAPEAVPRRKE